MTTEVTGDYQMVTKWSLRIDGEVGPQPLLVTAQFAMRGAPRPFRRPHSQVSPRANACPPKWGLGCTPPSRASAHCPLLPLSCHCFVHIIVSPCRFSRAAGDGMCVPAACPWQLRCGSSGLVRDLCQDLQNGLMRLARAVPAALCATVPAQRRPSQPRRHARPFTCCGGR